MSKPDLMPKNQSNDCDLVTTVAPLNLSQLEVQVFEWARQNRTDMLKIPLQDHKVNVNIQDNFNRTPLHFAASSGNLETVKLLIQYRATIDVMDKFGITPLMWSVYNNHKKVSIYLLDNGAKYTKLTKQGQTIIHFVAEANAIGILKYLYQKYHILKIDEPDHTGLTPFLVAAHRGNQTLMEVFYKQRCNVLQKDRRGRSALHLAAWKGHMGVMAYLLKLPQMLELINDLDSQGNSPLHYATDLNQQEIVRLLLIAGANPDITSETKDTPLIEVSRLGYHTCIETLLAHKANRKATTKNGNSALHEATLANLPDTIYFLIRHQFDVEATNNRGQTPLHLAVEQNKLETVEALLLVGASLGVKCKDGITPLEVAARASYSTLVDLIIQADRWREQNPDEVIQIRKRLLNQDDGGDRMTHDLAYDKGYSANDFMDNHDYRRVTLDGGQATESGSSSEWRGSGDLPGVYENPVGLAAKSLTETDSETDVGYRTPTSVRRASQPTAQQSKSNSTLHNQVGADSHMNESNFMDPFHDFPIVPPATSTTREAPIDSFSHSDNYSDELSLGFEAARVWDGGSDRTNQHALKDDLLSTNWHQFELHDTNASRNLGLGNRSIVGQEQVLPNGEVVICLGKNSMTNGSSAKRSTFYALSEEGQFSLLMCRQPYAEEMKVLFFKLAKEYSKPNDWKALAAVWNFKQEHVSAIEYQDTGKHSYEQHTYRLMCIWLHGLDVDQSPLNELYKALVAIHRTKLAEKLRKSVESRKKLKKGCRVQ
ncbi:hypothetical protein T265_07077 [Opisthorchis viverrini]|uniref:Death domain-containing protein n=1 Tax=Opisthorchis viverrini TaxID=6198 RepID=A0A074ZE55_OPIVI|nr:hypothetical protein T265_07077 [Opisthorchis viverrini]KER25453.1 hypothetical protein T265_07077 [Opisthorchis viverrini]